MQLLRFQFAAILALAPLLQGPGAGSSEWVTSTMAVASGREFGFEGEEDRLARASAALRARNAATSEPTSFDRACEVLLRHFARETSAPGAFAQFAEGVLAAPLALDDGELGLDSVATASFNVLTMDVYFRYNSLIGTR